MIQALAKWILCVALLLCCCAELQARVAAQSPTIEALYQQGLDAYRAPTPDLATARAIWTAALDGAAGESAARRAQLCKCLGNVAFRQERPLEAAAWFTAAIGLTPRDRDAWSNLEFARSKAGLEPADRGDLAATFDRVVHALSLAESEWLALGMALILGALVCLRAFVLGSAATRPLWVALVLACLCSLPWIVQSREAAGDPVFVISTAGVTVASEPRVAAAKVALLSAGARAQRLEQLAGWMRVETEHGERGWMPVDSVLALRR